MTAAGFWARAVEFFAAHGIEEIHRVLTDNGSCYGKDATPLWGPRSWYTRP